jgi:hypothetical protein
LINLIKKAIFVMMLIIKTYQFLHHLTTSSLNTRLLINKAVSALCFIAFLIIFISYSNGQNEMIKSDYNPNTGHIIHDSITTEYIIIKEIFISGNTLTKERIILREIGYETGDTIPTRILQKQLLWIKNRTFNTTLFLWVDINLTSPDSIYKVLNIYVRERMFITPLPTGGLIDRNFNEWWQDRHHDLRRIYYGVNLKIKNIWGLNHTLRIKGITGVNKKLETSYQIPYINKKLKTGLVINALMEFNSQVAFRTYEHKLQYIEHKGAGRTKYNIGFLFTRRNKFYIQHQLGPYFQYTSVVDTVVILNPDYFLKGANYQRSYGLKYIYTHDKRDFINYPLKGHLLKLEADYQYLNSIKTINTSSLRAEFTDFIPLNKIFYFAFSARGKISAPRHQPYFSQRGLGYNKEWVSGYERYVVDGQAFGLVKTNMKWRIFSINPTVKYVPLKKFRTIPLSLYFKIYSDAGYVVDKIYNPNNNFLSNRLLVGGGAGIDVVTYYDIVGRIEYSVNQLGQTGFYLHLKAGL